MKKQPIKLLNIFLYIFLFVGAIIMAMPFIWMVLTSMKYLPEVLRIPLRFLPEHIFNFKNYYEVLIDYNFLRYLLNSFIVSTGVTIFTVVFSSLAGYSFSKYKFPGRNAIFFILVIAILTIPPEALIIPQYILASKINLVNTYFGIMMPGLISAFGIFIMRQFCNGIPNDYIEAARIDGFSEFGLFMKIIVPLTKPAIATLAVLKFIWTWNDFLWPLVIANTDEMKTVTVGMTIFVSDRFTEYQLICAASFLSVLPMLILFILLQKYVIKGIMMTGIK